MQSILFDYLKQSKWNEIKDYILKNPDYNYNIYDSNYNYIIQYIIIYNQIELLQLILDNIPSIKLDVLDSDGRTILYMPIKFSYIKIFKLLLKYSTKIIGIPIIDIRDNNGYTALHYSIIFNNIDAFNSLLYANADPAIKDNKYHNCLLLAVIYNRLDMIKILINNNKIDINSTDNNNENALHYSTNYKHYTISRYLLNNNINLNTFDYTNKIISLQQAIILHDNPSAILLVDSGSDINHQDMYGNNSVHYTIIEKNDHMFYYIINNNNIQLKYNNINIDGNTVLHLFINNFDITSDKNINILKKLVINTNLNIQNNQGNTPLHLLIKNNIYLNEYKNKTLNIFIQNYKNNNILQLAHNKEKLISYVAESYYNKLKKNKKWILKWEQYCSDNNLKELKKIMKKNEPIKKLCLDKIKKIITTEQKSMPSLEYTNKINFIHGIPVKLCSYTGSTIDVIFGLMHLKNKFTDIGVILKSPLTQHPDLEKYYEKLGIMHKLDFINFELIWLFQKLYVPTYFDTNIKKLLDSKVKFIILPIGIELTMGSHANMLIWDVKNHILERFEPHGKYNPQNLNYNPTKLDLLLINRFRFFDEQLQMLRPIDYLPHIGFQILEIIETPYCTHIGDPSGFCAIWATWWVEQRLTYKKKKPDDLAKQLIEYFKQKNYGFKAIIRNYSGFITRLRDKYLDDVDLNINEWINNNYTSKQLILLEKNIINVFN